MESEYCSHLLFKRIKLLRSKFVLYRPILKDVKYIGLIIVPKGLRRAIFSHFHVDPTDGHMGEYKTLFRVHTRMFGRGNGVILKHT